MSAAQILATEDGHRPHELVAAELIPIIQDLYVLAALQVHPFDNNGNAVLARAQAAIAKYGVKS